ncbi:MAG: hypothetical protein QG596_1586 [Actinomycetota bacterium]|nr:hypothetical protein [Actinomycetota bacterium]
MIPFAHALASRGDLPIPAWLFAWGAAIVLVVSFFALSAAWRQPKFEETRWRAITPRLSRILFSWPVASVCGAIGALLLGFVVYVGFAGTDAPDRNFALTFVFVTVWLGFPVLSVLIGDFFRVFSPWRFLGRVVGGGVALLFRGPVPHLEYPERLGRWPAAAGLVAFVWLEIIYGSIGTSVSLSPEVVAQATVIYSIYTFSMMALFGVEKWNERGEFLAVYFNMFSQLSIFEVRDRSFGRRAPFSGAANWAKVPGSLGLVISAIAVTTFDGAQEGALRPAIEWLQETLGDLGFGVTEAVRGGDTIFLLIVIAFVAAIYLTGVKGMLGIPGAPSFAKLRESFAHTLVPIALAYLVAHYFSLFVFQEQAQFTFLLSDPLGDGSNLFGTAGTGIDYSVIGTSFVWYVQLIALLAGHVLGLVLAHDRAVFIWKDYRMATRSQYWMLAVMISFTCLGLYLLSVANQ